MNKGPHALSAFIVQHLIPPVAGVRDRFPIGPEFVLAVLLHVCLVYLFFLHEHYILQPFHKEPPAISVELIRESKPVVPKPEVIEKLRPDIFRNKESGGATYLKSGNAAKVEKDKAPADEEKVSKEMTHDAPTKTPIALPDWMKLEKGSYDLPKPQKSSAKRDAGRTDANKMSDHMGQGGGETFRNAVVKQILSCSQARERDLAPLRQFAHRMSFYFVIDRRGALQSLELSASSGVRRYDQVMHDIILQCQPYPPLPDYIEQGTVFPLNIEPNG